MTFFHIFIFLQFKEERDLLEIYRKTLSWNVTVTKYFFHIKFFVVALVPKFFNCRIKKIIILVFLNYNRSKMCNNHLNLLSWNCSFQFFMSKSWTFNKNDFVILGLITWRNCNVFFTNIYMIKKALFSVANWFVISLLNRSSDMNNIKMLKFYLDMYLDMYLHMYVFYFLTLIRKRATEKL